MGRPLYSRPDITVRVTNEEPPAPSPEQPTYEKWSYWNAFDPDSDEWFEADDAVYEAFITDASQVVPNSVSPTSPTTEEDDNVNAIFVDARPHFIRRSSPPSTLTSDSEEENPVQQAGRTRLLGETGVDSEESDDDSDHSVVFVPPSAALSRFQGSIDEGGRVYTVDEFIMRDEALFDSPVATPTLAASSPNTVQTSSDTSSSPTATRVEEEIPISGPLRAEEFEVPRTPPRVPRSSALSISDVLGSPVGTPLVMATPSPPPSVTPRMYTWGPTVVLPPTPVSPTMSRGPLPNLGARMSVAHIQPTFVPVNRIRG